MNTIFERVRLIGAIASIGILSTAPLSFGDDPGSNANFTSKFNGMSVGTAFTYDGGTLGESSEAITVNSESSGIRTFGLNHGVLQWDSMGGARAGYAQGYSGPYVGVQTDLGLEIGVRPYEVVGCISPYVGVGGEFAASPSWVLSQTPILNYIANSEKVGGSQISLSARLTLGVSCVIDNHSVMLYGFKQDAYRAPAGLAYPLLPDSYAEEGGGIRFDSHSLSVIGEVLYGVTQSTDPNAETGTKLGVSAKVRLQLPHKWALEAIADVERYDVKPAGQDPYPATLGVTGKLNIVTPL